VEHMLWSKLICLSGNIDLAVLTCGSAVGFMSMLFAVLAILSAYSSAAIEGSSEGGGEGISDGDLKRATMKFRREAVAVRLSSLTGKIRSLIVAFLVSSGAAFVWTILIAAGAGGPTTSVAAVISICIFVACWLFFGATVFGLELADLTAPTKRSS